ncbi:lymphotactin-like [Melanerpes formicivorus]|uniref:lymphotactin-like n=1 Tax=Melanerpes formicivorus TaxID=211600 RepID=UPI00358E5840
MTIYKLCDRGLGTAIFFSALTKEPPAMKLHVAALLVIFCLGILTMRTVEGSVVSQSMRRYNCVNLAARQLNIKNLISYEKIQGPVEAIMFINKRGVKVCVKPDHKQAQTAMKSIEERRAAEGR